MKVLLDVGLLKSKKFFFLLTFISEVINLLKFNLFLNLYFNDYY